MKKTVCTGIMLLAAATANAAPTSYTMDPNHTYPSFEADHAGLSTFRGKFRSTSGVVRLDREARSGDIEVTIDASSFDIGHDKLNAHVKSDAMLDVEKFPTVRYVGQFAKFDGDVPREIAGELTLHGVTKPVTLEIHSFLCRMDQRRNKEVCGANAAAQINRADFGVDFGAKMGFRQDVAIVIQVEAIAN